VSCHRYFISIVAIKRTTKCPLTFQRELFVCNNLSFSITQGFFFFATDIFKFIWRFSDYNTNVSEDRNYKMKIWKFTQRNVNHTPILLLHISILQDHQQGINFCTDFPVRRHKVCIISYNTNSPPLVQLRSGRSVASRILRNTTWVYKPSTICFYTREFSSNPKPNKMKPDRSQHDHHANWVTAHPYSSATFVSLRFHSRKPKLGDRLRNFIISNFALLKIA